VQTGFARTGKLFAMEHYGVVADITTMAKGLGGGFPIAAVTGRAEIMDAPGPGGLGGTYGGNPIGIAAGNAVLDVIEEEGLNERAESLGNRLKQRLHSLISEVPQIADIRGPGFMNAVEFNIPGSKTPNADFANAVRAKALDKGLILLTCGVYGNVIRFLSPITIQDNIFAEAMDILEDTLRECAKEA
jgi:4-aminobutyrate aminotransferase